MQSPRELDGAEQLLMAGLSPERQSQEARKVALEQVMAGADLLVQTALCEGFELGAGSDRPTHPILTEFPVDVAQGAPFRLLHQAAHGAQHRGEPVPRSVLGLVLAGDEHVVSGARWAAPAVDFV